MSVWRGNLVAALTVLADLTAVPAPGQQHASSQGISASHSTLNGVYTSAQAAQGQDRYALLCQTCHTASSHASPAFVAAWNGRTVLALFGYIELTMPMSDPGTLEPEETAELVAYLLKLNGLPPGDNPLSTNPDTLRTIRLDLATRQKDP